MLIVIYWWTHFQTLMSQKGLGMDVFPRERERERLRERETERQRERERERERHWHWEKQREWRSETSDENHSQRCSTQPSLSRHGPAQPCAVLWLGWARAPGCRLGTAGSTLCFVYMELPPCGGQSGLQVRPPMKKRHRETERETWGLRAAYSGLLSMASQPSYWSRRPLETAAECQTHYSNLCTDKLLYHVPSIHPSMGLLTPWADTKSSWSIWTLHTRTQFGGISHLNSFFSLFVGKALREVIMSDWQKEVRSVFIQVAG